MKRGQKVPFFIDDLLCDNYVLEVSSAGIGSPLKFLRQYHKNIGRIIDIKYGTGNQVRGILSAVIDDLVYVKYETKVKEVKKFYKKYNWMLSS